MGWKFSMLVGTVGGTIAYWAGIDRFTSAIVLIVTCFVYLFVAHWNGWIDVEEGKE